MAWTNSSQTIVDGPRNAIVKLIGKSDATPVNEASVLKVSASALSGAPTNLSIDKVYYSVSGSMKVVVEWNATSNVDCLVLSGDGTIDFTRFGGLKNNAGAGVNGDIDFSTISTAANDTYSIVLELKK